MGGLLTEGARHRGLFYKTGYLIRLANTIGSRLRLQYAGPQARP